MLDGCKVDFVTQIKLNYGTRFEKLNMIQDWIGPVYEVISVSV